MPDTSELSRNKAALDHCNKVYKYLFIAVFSVVLAAAVYSLLELFFSLLTLNINSFFSFLICGMILCPLSGGMMIYSGYKREDLFAYAAFVPLILGILLDFALDNSATIALIITGAVALASLAPTLLANARYRYLEDQEGFPHFSQLLLEQQKIAASFKVNDPFEAAARRYKETSSDSMKGIELSDEILAEKVKEKNNFMDEI